MNKVYGPHIRITNKTTKEVKKFNKVNKTNIPDPKVDPIVVNNICCNEFDYTEQP